MRLAAFILQEMEVILENWESFAATLLPGAAGMSPRALRDHARQMLEAIARDLDTPQTRAAQSEKSKGRAPQLTGAPETAAQTHAVLRARSGFDINQLVSEYRALRGSVVRLWIDSHPIDPEGVEDLIRFNEAVDQAVAESVNHFHEQEERARNLLLGMLGHDMRSPLNTIQATASYLAALNAGEQVSASAARLIRAGAAMQALLDDLEDFNRTKLGLSVRVAPADMDLAAVVADELDQIRGAQANRWIELAATGNCRGRWDTARLQQLVRNLVSNALRYGSPDTAVRVTVSGEASEACLRVANRGPGVDVQAHGDIFDPLKRASVQEDGGDRHGGLGLGLFIVREIAKAHGGTADVHCEAGETVFAVHLPR